jgi:hypothetical protein
MPTSDEHIDQASRNHCFLTELKTYELDKKFGDWIVTISFYQAVHLLEALIYDSSKLYFLEHGQKGLKSTTIIKHSDQAVTKYATHSRHVARKYLLRDNPDYFFRLYDDYKSLEELSFTSRYTCQDIDSDIVVNATKYLNHVVKIFEIRSSKRMAPCQPNTDSQIEAP